MPERHRPRRGYVERNFQITGLIITEHRRLPRIGVVMFDQVLNKPDPITPGQPGEFSQVSRLKVFIRRNHRKAGRDRDVGRHVACRFSG